MNTEVATTQELLAVLIGADRAELISKYDISFLAKQDDKFFKGEGLTQRQANIIQSVFEISRRKTLNDANQAISSIRSANDVFRVMQPQMVDLAEEHFRVLMLDTHCQLIGIEEISFGGIDATIVDLRVLFKKLLMGGASRFIACHNHPSGNTTPSRPDKDLTSRIYDASKTMGIKFDDHIIIGKNSYYSFNEEGEL